ncbi:hypothetical protein M3A49_13215 [Paraburkholderia sp. CNPSo 3076]|uniref:hypothetical protein n=1 Tax=Paraburkholderia sp. CNPSo 3076 TaxID=2940936 RepID=UPI002251AE1F|nr:hypothetical protein [Paraburkholderia sp. CNPSo 3076]MCX5540444.1 hypothetical protein [Paraburkholderia sp. CNPSo 3076]
MVGLVPAAIYCELDVRYPIFGFPYLPDVIAAHAESGRFVVFGLARELPETSR